MKFRPTEQQTTEKLAQLFIKHLRESLDPTELRTAQARNEAEPDPMICHSHDFCDANMVMDAAWQEMFGFSAADANDEDQAKFWSEAWKKAVEIGFVDEKESVDAILDQQTVTFWREHPTGGGCMAWRWDRQEDGGGDYVLITDADGIGLYANPDAPVWLIGWYNPNEGWRVSEPVTLHRALEAAPNFNAPTDDTQEDIKISLDLDCLTEPVMEEAAAMDDEDAAFLFMQKKANVFDGGIAGLVMSGYDWKKMTKPQRMEAIRDWIRQEREGLIDDEGSVRA